MKEEQEKINTVGRMKKRRILMRDEKRYLIYYTFGDADAPEVSTAENPARNLAESRAEKSMVEETEV